MLSSVTNFLGCGSKTAAPPSPITSQDKFFLITFIVGGIIFALGALALASYLNPGFLPGTHQLTITFATKVGTDVMTVAIFGLAVGGGVTLVAGGTLLGKVFRHYQCGCKVDSLKSWLTSLRTPESIGEG